MIFWPYEVQISYVWYCMQCHLLHILFSMIYMINCVGVLIQSLNEWSISIDIWPWGHCSWHQHCHRQHIQVFILMNLWPYEVQISYVWYCMQCHLLHLLFSMIYMINCVGVLIQFFKLMKYFNRHCHGGVCSAPRSNVDWNTSLI